MPSQTPSLFASRFQLSTADLQLFRTNSFRLIQFRKNASANPLDSHTFKTKDLKPFRFTHFQKKGRGWVPLSNIQPQTDHPTRMVVPSERSEPRDLPSNLCSSLTPLDSALTSKPASKPFTSNTYEKHTQGEGGYLKGSVASEPAILAGDEGSQCSGGREPQSANHESRQVTAHARPCLTGLLRLSTMPVSSMNVCGSIGLALGPAATRWAAMFMGGEDERTVRDG